MNKTIEVDVYGQRLSIQGEADGAYMDELVHYVEGQMDRVAQGLATTTPTKIAILAALNIADQLFKQEQRRQIGEAEVEQRASKILQSIEAHLDAPHVSVVPTLQEDPGSDTVYRSEL